MSRKATTELKEISNTNITANYTNFGAPIVSPIFTMVMINTTDIEVYISEDGVVDKFRVPAGGTLSFDVASILDNADDTVYLLANKTQLQIKQQNSIATATFGDVYANVVGVS